MPLDHLIHTFERQRDACAELGSPLYAALLDGVAADLRAGGVCGAVLAGHEEAPGGHAVPLRLLGGVHALVLTGRAPELAAYYPSAGGLFRPTEAGALWRAFRDTLAARRDEVRDWLSRPPQTNEVGRAGLLLAGLLYAADRHPGPVRLFELGASAGLNLRADRFRLTAPGLVWGPADAPVRLPGAWTAPVPEWLTGAARRHPELTLAERRGCDPDPVDPCSPEGALALRAYVWPDQRARAARLEGALRLAAEVPARVERRGAADFLAEVRTRPGTLTVVWHSVMRQYVPRPEWRRVEEELARLAAESGPDAGFAHLAFEPQREGAPDGPAEEHRFALTARLGTGPLEELAEAHPHGLPARGNPRGTRPRV
ncbi:DUF2332 domain-containing protein [Streptomyces sp. JJ36]|uniref:DUF2332 domain-containing protein n=1 Tax=Streptomyces sp. JJ36 TaxID=2736645 RepID=UPI001F3EB941|nr:DUF2332 domain-containing protein [Streptomyces sp. JJ36]MCF6526206.1 DUF2332 domain-containing protein [Streptomyces sp. JJ36]